MFSCFLLHIQTKKHKMPIHRQKKGFWNTFQFFTFNCYWKSKLGLSGSGNTWVVCLCVCVCVCVSVRASMAILLGQFLLNLLKFIPCRSKDTCAFEFWLINIIDDVTSASVFFLALILFFFCLVFFFFSPSRQPLQVFNFRGP